MFFFLLQNKSSPCHYCIRECGWRDGEHRAEEVHKKPPIAPKSGTVTEGANAACDTGVEGKEKSV